MLRELGQRLSERRQERKRRREEEIDASFEWTMQHHWRTMLALDGRFGNSVHNLIPQDREAAIVLDRTRLKYDSDLTDRDIITMVYKAHLRGDEETLEKGVEKLLGEYSSIERDSIKRQVESEKIPEKPTQSK